MNNDIKVRYRSQKVFNIAMQLAFTSEYDNEVTAVGYKIKDNKLFLFHYGDASSVEGITLFPYKMNLQQCTTFVWGWLLNIKPIGEYPDTDGSVEQGFNITTDGCDWRGGSKFYGSFISIEPVWIAYGK